MVAPNEATKGSGLFALQGPFVCEAFRRVVIVELFEIAYVDLTLDLG